MLGDSITNDEENWQMFYTSMNPIDVLMPEPYESVNQLIKLVIFKCLRPDALHSVVERFVCSFDETFIVSEQISLKAAFECSTPKTPLIYFTSTAIDATADIWNLAYEVNASEK